MRLEFPSRGSVYIPWFVCIQDALQYGEGDNDTVAKFYNKIISCSSDIREHKTYI